MRGESGVGDLDAWERMACICLQRNWLVPSKYLKQLTVRNGHMPFFYPVLGPLGNVVLGEWWRAFVRWFAERNAEPDYFPLVPDLSFTNPWVMSQQGRENVWTSWFDRFAYETGGHCLYPNLPLGLGLVVNHAGPGLHYKGVKGDDARMVLNDSSAEYSEWTSRKLLHIPLQPVRVGFDGSTPPAADSETAEGGTAAAFLQAELHPMDTVLHLHVHTAISCANTCGEEGARVSWHDLVDFSSLVKTWESWELDTAAPSVIDAGRVIDVVAVTFAAAVADSDAAQEEAAFAIWSACEQLRARLHGGSRVVLLGSPRGTFVGLRTRADVGAEVNAERRLQLSHSITANANGSDVTDAVFQPWSAAGYGRIAVEVAHRVARGGRSGYNGTQVELFAELHGMIQGTWGRSAPPQDRNRSPHSTQPSLLIEDRRTPH